jgi:hypothetical protein
MVAPVSLVTLCGAPETTAVGRRTIAVVIGGTDVSLVLLVAAVTMVFVPTFIVRMSKVQLDNVTVAADIIPLTVTDTVAVESTAPLIVWKVAMVGVVTGFMVKVVTGADTGPPPVADKMISGPVPSGIISSG